MNLDIWEHVIYGDRKLLIDEIINKLQLTKATKTQRML